MKQQLFWVKVYYKIVFENMCVSWNKQYGIPVGIVHPFHIYGPGMRLDDGRVYADFISDIIFNRNIKMKSDGSAIRAFCYLADAVVGFFTVLLKGESTHAYNIGNEEGEISIRDLATMLVSLFHGKGLKCHSAPQVYQVCCRTFVPPKTIVSIIC